MLIDKMKFEMRFDLKEKLNEHVLWPRRWSQLNYLKANMCLGSFIYQNHIVYMVRSYVVGWSLSLGRSVLSVSVSIKENLSYLNQIVLINLLSHHEVDYQCHVLNTVIHLLVGLDYTYLLGFILNPLTIFYSKIWKLWEYST